MKVHVDEDKCEGHGRCYALAPEIFDCDDDGHGEVRDEHRGTDGGPFRSGDLDDAAMARAKSAVDNCPEAAITFVDD